jgi:hypothetical protein
MKVLGKYLFQGGDTQGLPVDKEWCIYLLCNYLESRKRYRWVLKNDTLFVTDQELNHIVTLRWHRCGFHLEEDFEELSGKGMEIVLISVNIVFRSVCNIFSDFADMMEDNLVNEESETEENDEDYWI